jgi:putative transposase
MQKNKQQDIALMRYSAIAPLISGLSEDYRSMNAYFRAVSAKGVMGPDGSLRHYSPCTIQKWYLAYQKSGFEALVPKGRSDCGVSRKLDQDLQEEIRYLKRTYPRLSAAAIYRQLQDRGSITKKQVSESTILRFVNQIVLQEQMNTGQDMRRYERPHINEVWCGDSSAGPWLRTEGRKKHRVYVIALIDDASRFVTGADVFFNDTFVNLMSVIRSAVSKYGIPAMFNFDNGGAYRNRQMELLAARIGTTINYCQPYAPVQKAKIERWFRTMKDQWMASLDMQDYQSLDEVRGSLLAYVNMYNQTIHSSLGGKTPQERFFSEPERIRRLAQEKIDRSFLLEVERRVSADSVITIDNVEYEVDCRFAKQKITIRYSPDMKSVYVVESEDVLTPVHLLNKTENSHVKREKIHLSGGDR